MLKQDEYGGLRGSGRRSVIPIPHQFLSTARHARTTHLNCALGDDDPCTRSGARHCARRVLIHPPARAIAEPLRSQLVRPRAVRLL
jgi:hypothetical protein